MNITLYFLNGNMVEFDNRILLLVANDVCVATATNNPFCVELLLL